jgi:hypothetical protein
MNLLMYNDCKQQPSLFSLYALYNLIMNVYKNLFPSILLTLVERKMDGRTYSEKSVFIRIVK